MTEVIAIQGDITSVEVDAIVNAANSELRPGGGVDGAIHAAGGPDIAEETRSIADRRGKLPTGEAVATTAGKLPARHVIHTVGPIWGGVDEGEAVRLLANCYRNSLDIATELGCASVAFPNISTGVYGFPKRKAAETAITAVREWIDENPTALTRVMFVSFTDDNQELYEQLLSD